MCGKPGKITNAVNVAEPAPLLRRAQVLAGGLRRPVAPCQKSRKHTLQAEGSCMYKVSYMHYRECIMFWQNVHRGNCALAFTNPNSSPNFRQRTHTQRVFSVQSAPS